MDGGLVAYGDESMRNMGGERLYLLAATTFSGDEGPLLARLSRMKGPRAAKLHWRELGRGAQADIMSAIAEAPSATTVVIGSPMNPRKQERARRKCLEAMVGVLSEGGVGGLVLESRGEGLDLSDVKMMDALRSKGLGGAIRLSHERGGDNPRLWVPDQVLGAYGDSLCGGNAGERWDKAWKALECGTRLEVVRL